MQLERRLAYGILTREGMRASELASLKWRDVDLERGRVRLDENKTDDPRAWALAPDVVRSLTWWKKRTEGQPDDLVLGLDLHEASRWLRGRDDDPERYPGDLRRADITRPELFERSATRMPMRLHDLRATFVTVSLANGETEQWVTDRTGHKSSQMLALYTRQARTWSELALGLLSPLDALLPEFEAPAEADAKKKPMRPAADAIVPPVWASNGHRRVGHDRLELSANGLRVDQEGAQSEGLRDVAARDGVEVADRDPACFSVHPDDSSRNVTVKDAECTPSTTTSSDSAGEVERALARALDAAAAAGRFDVVAQLARELEARRLAGLGNVVAIDAGKRRRSE